MLNEEVVLTFSTELNMLEIGKLICLEGPEGAGKSTQLTRLQLELDSTGKFVFVREPGGTPFGEDVRKVIFAHKVAVDSQFLLFMASRLHIFETVVRPALAQGKHVITDRMDASTFAYQVFGTEHLRLEDMFNLLRRIYLAPIGTSDWLVPQYIFLDVKPEVGLSRRRSSSEALNSFDLEALPYHKRVYAGYQHFIPLQRGSSSIDASRSEEEVFQDILHVVHTITQ